MRYFETGATRDNDDKKLDYEGFLSPRVLQRYAMYMHKHRYQADGNIRDSDNWQKGIPKEAYMKSMWRHFMDVWMAWRNVGTPLTPYGFQEALCALLFNVMGLLHELLKESEYAQPLANDPQLALGREDLYVHRWAVPGEYKPLPLPESMGGRLPVPSNPAPFPKFPPEEGF